MKIAITGATGFLGRTLVAMAAARGHDVTATARGITGPADFGGKIRFAPADLNDAAVLRSAIADCEIIVHTAALSAAWGHPADFERVNVTGTCNVVNAASAAPARRLVHVSSTSLYFAFRDRFAIAEQAPLPSPVNAYAATKRRAEEEAQRFAGEVFIARPRGIFGPGDPHLLPRLLKAASRGPLPLLRGGLAVADITYVETIADALLAMAEAPAQHAGVYNIAQGEPIAIRDLADRLLEGVGQRARWRPVPVGLALAGARLLEAGARLDPGRREPLVTTYGLGLFAYAQTLDLSRAHQILGWRPPLGLDEAIARTIRAFRGNP
jgi:nucleoside-diphosphate-sugar epimerase